MNNRELQQGPGCEQQIHKTGESLPALLEHLNPPTLILNVNTVML